MKFPIILIDIPKIKELQLGIIISKSKISFTESRFNFNLELIGLKFCDSEGKIFTLKSIKKLSKNYNPLNFLLLLERQTFGEYNFVDIHKKISLVEFKVISNKITRIENSEKEANEIIQFIDKSDSDTEIIGLFTLGKQG